LIAALKSPDARTRWGATRLFNQHFRELTSDPELLAALESNLNDPIPFVRFQAASGLWRWYYWQVDQQPVRRGTLEALATRLNTETDPMVRRGLEESVYDLLDENTGYLEAWVRASAKDEDKNRIGDGYEAVVRDQAEVLAKVLRESTPLGREGILNALWDFHIRHYALPPLKADTVSIGLPAVLTKYVSGVPDLHIPGYEYPPYREAVNFKYDVHNGFFQTRIGNDSDLIHFFKSSGPELENALLACLQGADDSMKIEVLKAGSTLSGAGDERFTLAALELSEDSSADVRQTVRYVYEDGQRGILNLDAPEAPDPKLVNKVVEILRHGNPDSQAVVLPLLAGLPENSAWEQQTEVLEGLRALLQRQPRPANYARVLNAASSFKSLMQDAALREQVLAGLNDSSAEVERAALSVSLEHFLNNPETAPQVKTAFANLRSSARGILIEEVGDPKFMRRHLGVSGGAVSQDQQYFLGRNAAYQKPPDFLGNPIVLDTVLATLRDPDANARAAALDVLLKVKDVEQRPDFRAALDELQKDSNPRLKLIATSVLGGKKLSEALKDVQPGSVLDFNYFVTKVEPILSTPGADGKACVYCHANHVIFKLQPPTAEGVFSPQDSKENYKYAMRVVDIINPADSLILIKPTRPTDSAANVGDYLATHNGGQRWPGNETSWQYRTILEWIRGSQASAAVAAR
jgi:HEAT repeat protein